MGHVKDLWTRPEEQPDGKVVRVPNARHGKGKRWLAVWLDPDGNERTKAFTNKAPADKYWRDQESARDHGEYVDPKAGKGLVSELAARWLASHPADPATLETYERVWRLHVGPVFGKRRIKSMTKPSEVQELLSKLEASHTASTARLAAAVLGGILNLAVADNDLKANPVHDKFVKVPVQKTERPNVWSDETLFAVIDAHPPELQALPYVGATTGLREGELYGLADVDIEDDVLHVQRQIKRIGTTLCFGLPKNDTAREVPLGMATRAMLRRHMDHWPPVAITLPWEKPDGEPRTYRLVFTQPGTGKPLYRQLFNRYWSPALVAAGVIAPPKRSASGHLVYGTNRKYGRHALRHYYAAMQLAGGVNIRELADYLGHSDPAFTLRVYGRLQPNSQDRARQAVDARFLRPRGVAESGGEK